MSAFFRLLLLLLMVAPIAVARDAAFMEPGTVSGKGSNNEALVADPKLFEAGESTVGIGRRVSLFFVNVGAAPLTLDDVSVTGDGNVTVQHEDGDCRAGSKVASASRCTVALNVTPTSAGGWSVEILVRHDGVGRIARALVKGKAVQDAKSATRGEGLNLSSRDIKPLEFGDVAIGGAPAVRTVLMVNDSPEPLVIKAIDLIMVDEQLERLLTGCATDLELKPDASCPITLKWKPHAKGSIATDLIIRHTGKTGFTVIPVRGQALGGVDGMSDMTSQAPTGSMHSPIVPPSPSEVEQVTGALPPVVSHPTRPVVHAPKDYQLFLIGVVGRRAILQREGVTRSVDVGGTVDVAGVSVKLLSLTEREARVLADGLQRSVKFGASGYRPTPAASSSASVKEPLEDELEAAVASSNSQSSSGK